MSLLRSDLESTPTVHPPPRWGNVAPWPLSSRSAFPTLQQRPKVLELVEEVPDVVVATGFAVRVEIRQLGVFAVAVEVGAALPLDEDQYLSWLDLALDRLGESSEGHDSSSVALHLSG